MTTNYFMPSTDSGKADLLDHLSSTLPRYAALLDVSTVDIAALKADADAFRYTLHAQTDVLAYNQHWTAYKNVLRDGGNGMADWPIALTLATPVPPAVSPGVIARLAALAAHIKTHKNYTSAIGQDLWLIGSSQVVDPNTWKPILTIQNQAGHPIIVWSKGQASAIEIWVDRGDGHDFVLLTINTEPNTTDSSPLPAAGASALWKYKAIYRLHDEQVGQWSDVISVSVGG